MIDLVEQIRAGIPKLCSVKKCPYKAYYFECIIYNFPISQKLGGFQINGACTLHKKDFYRKRHPSWYSNNTKIILFSSKEELENEILLLQVMDG